MEGVWCQLLIDGGDGDADMFENGRFSDGFSHS
jgi:hypothetical protein